jgi:ATP-binding cassette subfamily C protein CydCD
MRHIPVQATVGLHLTLVEVAMHFERRLWIFTRGVRLRIAWAVLLGLIAAALGVARLGLLGWLIGMLFSGAALGDLILPVIAIAAVMVLRGAFEHWRALAAHETAARVQVKLRRAIYEKIAALGPGSIGRQRSGALSLSPRALLWPNAFRVARPWIESRNSAAKAA